MTTAYPSAIDNFTNPLASDSRTSPSHASQHDDINDAIEAIETELGTLPKGAFASVKARLNANSPWDAEIVKATDDTVTNSATLTNDSELSFALTASSIYVVEFLIIFSGNDATGDYKWAFAYPTLTLARQANGFYNHLTSADASALPSSLGSLTQWPTTAVVNGVDASHSKFVMQGRFTLVTNGSGTLNFQFAQNSAVSAKDAKTWTGSRLRYKKLA
jgi:hypothetical protein